MNRVQKLRVGGVDVYNSLIGSLFELFAAVLVFVRRAENGYYLSLGGKGNGSRNFRAALLHRLDYARRRKVDELVVVSCKFNSDFLSCDVN